MSDTRLPVAQCLALPAGVQLIRWVNAKGGGWDDGQTSPNRVQPGALDSRDCLPKPHSYGASFWKLKTDEAPDGVTVGQLEALDSKAKDRGVSIVLVGDVVEALNHADAKFITSKCDAPESYPDDVRAAHVSLIWPTVKVTNPQRLPVLKVLDRGIDHEQGRPPPPPPTSIP